MLCHVLLFSLSNIKHLKVIFFCNSVVNVHNYVVKMSSYTVKRISDCVARLHFSEKKTMKNYSYFSA